MTLTSRAKAAALGGDMVEVKYRAENGGEETGYALVMNGGRLLAKGTMALIGAGGGVWIGIKAAANGVKNTLNPIELVKGAIGARR